jgi:hypothetical protein
MLLTVDSVFLCGLSDMQPPWPASECGALRMQHVQRMLSLHVSRCALRHALVDLMYLNIAY